MEVRDAANAKDVLVQLGRFHTFGDSPIYLVSSHYLSFTLNNSTKLIKIVRYHKQM